MADMRMSDPFSGQWIIASSAGSVVGRMRIQGASGLFGYPNLWITGTRLGLRADEFKDAVA